MVTEPKAAPAAAVYLEQVQEELLGLLQNASTFLSGAQLAARLQLSRTAVWKRIERLRSLGYQVEGSSRRGYRLAPGQELLLPAAILADLPLQRLAGPVHHYVSLPSTNDAAKELARQGAPEGTLVVAERQTAGRGRLGRVWESPPFTGLYLTLILRPPRPPAELPTLTLTAAVAAVEALQTATGVTTGIKWPNDIIFQGKKLGGILTEMETESDRMSFVVLGVGLNLNTPVFPEHLREIATSLAVTGRTYSRLATLRALLQALDHWYDVFLRDGFGDILARWRQATVTLGKVVCCRQGEREITGLAREIAPDGALIVVRPDGTEERVLSGEIQPAG